MSHNVREPRTVPIRISAGCSLFRAQAKTGLFKICFDFGISPTFERLDYSAESSKFECVYRTPNKIVYWRAQRERTRYG